MKSENNSSLSPARLRNNNKLKKKKKRTDKESFCFGFWLEIERKTRGGADGGMLELAVAV